MEDMTVLVPATQAKSTAESAPLAMELKQLAYAINNAANCGNLTVVYVHPISDEARQQLESKGYQIFNTDRSSLGRDNVSKEFTISWKN